MGKPEAADGGSAPHTARSPASNMAMSVRLPVESAWPETSLIPRYVPAGNGRNLYPIAALRGWKAVKVPRNLRLPGQVPGRMEGMSAFDGSGRQSLYELALENDVDDDDRYADDGGTGHDQGKVTRIP